ncbi:MAG TPA: hypothetical protein DDW94_10370 [Deltaproteobacteria bacterium]|nr:MAG: hypothetical protein A2Z79_07215 [Deltaproteobacteria bacterium GWA2_55_82]OIJ74968.1 MAG: hypothetical protein A2V21_312240 [Deltaproteobacteria bacterium GWC2_55_46]HBG47377.1 hypothetical protein [Deltaproteobacteria bacterium]
MSEDMIAGLIIVGLWFVFMAILIIVNKKRRSVDTGEAAEHHQIGIGFGRDVGKDMDLPGGIGHRKDNF